MDSSSVAFLVADFNFFAILLSVLLALCGVIALIGGRFGLRLFCDGNKAFIRAFCVASLAAIALEATAFNLSSYLRFFSGPEVYSVGMCEEKPNQIIMSDGSRGTLFTQRLDDTTTGAGIVFRNVDMPVTSIYVNADYHDNDLARVNVVWSDAAGSRMYSKYIYKYFPRENHMLAQPSGKAAEIAVMITDNIGSKENKAVEFTHIALNKPIPFSFSGLRLLAVSLIIFAILIMVNKKLREKTGYYLFEYRLDPSNKKQNFVYAATVVLLIIFSWLSIYTATYTVSKIDTWKNMEGYQVYNRFLVDALIAGRTNIEWGNPEKLLALERPHFEISRRPDVARPGVDFNWDYSWYNGKFYSYYGVVPAVLLFVPYKLITGNYLTNHAGIFIFAAISIVLLAALWRFCVRKYMPNARFVFYMLSFLTLFFASGLFAALSFPLFYSIVQVAGFMFALAGILLLLKSIDNEKINRVKLFFACLCFALVVGCRPSMMFVSLLVPFVLWKRRSWKLLAFVSVPYIIVAIPLAWYNYIRFDSIFEFGQSYCLNIFDMSATGLVNPLGKTVRTLISMAYTLFGPLKYTLTFPYVECFSRSAAGLGTFYGIALPGEVYAGVINFPVVFFLLYLFKNIVKKGINTDINIGINNDITSDIISDVTTSVNKNIDTEKSLPFNLLWGFLTVAAVTIFVNSYTQLNGMSVRYATDYSIYIILASLFCACYWSDKSGGGLPYRARMKVVYAILAATIFVGACLFVTGGLNYITLRDPLLFRYLEYSLGVVRVW